MKLATITPQFVELMPPEIREGVLYVSEEYGTAIHNCCCGCGMKVVTSLSPARWQLHREGDFVSLHPSIGNWDFPCRSHYWIKRNRVVWSRPMTEQKVRRVKKRDMRDIQNYIVRSNQRKMEGVMNQRAPSQVSSANSSIEFTSLMRLLKKWWGG